MSQVKICWIFICINAASILLCTCMRYCQFVKMVYNLLSEIDTEIIMEQSMR